MRPDCPGVKGIKAFRMCCHRKCVRSWWRTVPQLPSHHAGVDYLRRSAQHGVFYFLHCTLLNKPNDGSEIKHHFVYIILKVQKTLLNFKPRDGSPMEERRGGTWAFWAERGRRTFGLTDWLTGESWKSLCTFFCVPEHVEVNNDSSLSSKQIFYSSDINGRRTLTKHDQIWCDVTITDGTCN